MLIVPALILILTAATACTKSEAGKRATPDPAEKRVPPSESRLVPDDREPLCLKVQPTGYGDRLGCRDGALFTPIAPIAFGVAEESFVQQTALPIYVQTVASATNPKQPLVSDGRRTKLQEALLLLIRTLRTHLNEAITCAQKGGGTRYPGGARYLKEGITEFLNGGEFTTKKPWGSVLAIGSSASDDARHITFEYRDIKRTGEPQPSRLYYLGILAERLADDRDASDWAERLFVALLPYWDARRPHAPQDKLRPPLAGCFAALALKSTLQPSATDTTSPFFKAK